jgi:hypothetical protein
VLQTPITIPSTDSNPSQTNSAAREPTKVMKIPAKRHEKRSRATREPNNEVVAKWGDLAREQAF